MYSTNEVHLIGNLGNAPELRTVGESHVAQFRLATSERFKDKTGEVKERTEWHTIVCWNRLAEVVAKSLKKGSYVAVNGAISYRSYADKKDPDRRIYVTEIRADEIGFLDPKPGGATPSENEAESDNDNAPPDDDDMPF